jgi:hypothetical protein
MPSYVIVESSRRTGEMIDAIVCDPNAVTSQPDRKSDTPVRVRVASERLLYVDDQPRAFISSIGQNGTTTYLVNGRSTSVRNRERRAALARVSSLLHQLATCLQPLRQESDEPGLATEGLGCLFNWLSDEQERLTEGARHGSQ